MPKAKVIEAEEFTPRESMIQTERTRGPRGLLELDRAQLFSWMANVVSTIAENDEEPCIFQLDFQQDRTHTVVEQFKYFPNQSDLKKVADDIADKAEDDAAGAAAVPVARYTVTCNKLRGRHAFWIRVPEEEGDGYASEEPTARGVTQMMMRHNEAAQERAYKAAMQQIAMLQKEIARKDSRIERLEDAHFKNIEAQEAALNMRHQRELELEQMQNEERRKEQVSSSLLGSIPLLLGHFTGNPQLGGGNSTPVNGLVKEFMGSVTEDQFKQLQTILREDQVMKFATIHHSLSGDPQPLEAPPNPNDSNGAAAEDAAMKGQAPS